MNVTVAALLGLTMAQPPAADYHVFDSRKIALPIQYTQDKRAIRQVILFASEDRGNTWSQAAEGPPTQEAFAFAAPRDGLYWFQIQVVDLQGRKDPANLYAEPPAMKVLVDTTKPAVALTSADRAGDQVVIEWRVDESYPNEKATRVSFRAANMPDGYWEEVTLPPGVRNGVRFKPGTTGPVAVKVTAADLAGNTGEAVKEFPAVGTGNPTTASLSPGSATPAGAREAAASPAGPIPPPASIIPTGPVAPPGGPIAPPTPPQTASGGLTSPGSPGVVSPTSPPASSVPPATAAPPLAVGQGTPFAPGSSPAPSPAAPVAPAGSGYPGGPAVLAVGTGPGAPSPTVEMSRAQVINYLRFDLAYEVEQRGPSGISRVDLWVTRDDGRTWVRWSQHDGREGAVRVALDARGDGQPNRQPEGLYGFRLVPVSGAGLSDPPPNPNDAPDVRVVVDVTAPLVKILPPRSDPSQPDALELRWEVTDANLGGDPIALDWAEHPGGPWRPVATAGDGVIQAAGGVGPRRLPNTGSYLWRVPTGLPPRVYLKVSARDAAGNATEVVTPGPVLIDLSRPRAKITGIGTAPAQPRP